MIDVEIYNQTKFQIKKDKLVDLSKFVLKKINRKINISIILVDKKEIKRVNKLYRGIDKATDALSFNYGEEMYGEILLCPEYLNNEASKLKTPQKLLYESALIHSLLHLCGFDHETQIQAGVMEKQEKRLHISYKSKK